MGPLARDCQDMRPCWVELYPWARSHSTRSAPDLHRRDKADDSSPDPVSSVPCWRISTLRTLPVTVIGKSSAIR